MDYNFQASFPFQEITQTQSGPSNLPNITGIAALPDKTPNYKKLDYELSGTRKGLPAQKKQSLNLQGTTRYVDGKGIFRKKEISSNSKNDNEMMSGNPDLLFQNLRNRFMNSIKRKGSSAPRTSGSEINIKEAVDSFSKKLANNEMIDSSSDTEVELDQRPPSSSISSGFKKEEKLIRKIQKSDLSLPTSSNRTNSEVEKITRNLRKTSYEAEIEPSTSKRFNDTRIGSTMTAEEYQIGLNTARQFSLSESRQSIWEINFPQNELDLGQPTNMSILPENFKCKVENCSEGFSMDLTSYENISKEDPFLSEKFENARKLFDPATTKRKSLNFDQRKTDEPNEIFDKEKNKVKKSAILPSGTTPYVKNKRIRLNHEASEKADKFAMNWNNPMFDVNIPKTFGTW